jgi:tetratricopeptide (TPR) repeat protein
MTRTRSLGWLLAFSISLASLSACSGAQERKASFIQKGEAFMAERNYAKARLEFRNALQIDPDTRTQTLAATAAEKAGEFREAATLYRSALEDPANIEARASLAKLYIFSGVPDEARKLVDEGLSKASSDPTLLAVRGATRMLRGDKAGARADGEAALKVAPDNEDAAALLASLLAQEGKRDEAIVLIEGAARRKPNSIELPVILAQLYAASDRKAEAEGQLKRVVELDPTSLPNRYRLAQFQALVGRMDAAEDTLREIIRRAPEDVDAKLALANLITSQRSFDAGEKSLKELVASDEGNLPLRMGLGRFYEGHGHPKEAEAVYRGVIAEGKSEGPALEARNRLASLALQAGRAEDAEALLQQVLDASPRDNEALVMRAKLAMGSGDAPAAIADLRSVLRDQPSSQPLLRTLAEAHSANGDSALAEETLRAASQVNPRDIATRLALARFLIDAGRADEAQPVVDQLVADQPADVPSLEAALRVQMVRRDYAAARRSAEAIQRVRPDGVTGPLLLGKVAHAEGKLDEARVSLEKALALAPDSIDPLGALVRVDLAQKAPERALVRLDGVIARHPKSPVVRNLKAEVLASVERWDEVAALAAETSALAPRWWAPYRSRAIALAASNRPDDAIATLRDGVAKTGGAPVLATDLAALYVRRGQPDLAIAEYEAWLQRDPRSEVAANNLAMMLITYRAKDQAALERALDLSRRFQSSGNPAFLDTYAWVRYTRGEYNEAVPALQRAVDLAPRVAPFRARLGLAQLGAGQRDAARQNLESALGPEVRFAGVDEARAALAELKQGS